MGMKFSGVIFDMDGVLINSEPLHQKVGLRMFQELRIPINEEMFLRFTGSTVISMWRIIKEEFHLKQTPEELALAYNQRFVVRLVESDDVTLFDGVLEVLENLHSRNIPVALASSSSREIIDTVLMRFGITQFFQITVSGSEVTHSKPHPEIFLLAAKKLNVPPSKCIVIEDSVNGVLAARYAGMYCVGYKPLGNNQDIPEASTIIKSFGEFNYKLLEK